MDLFFKHLVCCHSNIYYLTCTRLYAGGREFNGDQKQTWPLPRGVYCPVREEKIIEIT